MIDDMEAYSDDEIMEKCSEPGSEDISSDDDETSEKDEVHQEIWRHKRLREDLLGMEQVLGAFPFQKNWGKLERNRSLGKMLILR
ncbi:hypothetical protein RB195_025184 [Necator americanus]